VIGEDLIESAPRPRSARRGRVEAAVRHPAGAAGILVLGLLAGSIAGFVVGHTNPQTLAGMGYFIGSFPPEPQPLDIKPFEQTYGRTPLPRLNTENLTTLGEVVTGEFSLLSARSAIPVMCGTSIGQPGSPNVLDVSYPSTVFRVEGGQLSQLVWPLANATVASAALQVLTLQAQQCPDEPLLQTTMTTSGVLDGIGDQYAIFSRRPINAGDEDGLFATAVMVRVGADLVEISLASYGSPAPDAQYRVVQIATVAAEVASGG